MLAVTVESGGREDVALGGAAWTSVHGRAIRPPTLHICAGHVDAQRCNGARDGLHRAMSCCKTCIVVTAVLGFKGRPWHGPDACTRVRKVPVGRDVMRRRECQPHRMVAPSLRPLIFAVPPNPSVSRTRGGQNRLHGRLLTLRRHLQKPRPIERTGSSDLRLGFARLHCVHHLFLLNLSSVLEPNLHVRRKESIRVSNAHKEGGGGQNTSGLMRKFGSRLFHEVCVWGGERGKEDRKMMQFSSTGEAFFFSRLHVYVWVTQLASPPRSASMGDAEPWLWNHLFCLALALSWQLTWTLRGETPSCFAIDSRTCVDGK